MSSKTAIKEETVNTEADVVEVEVEVAAKPITFKTATYTTLEVDQTIMTGLWKTINPDAEKEPTQNDLRELVRQMVEQEMVKAFSDGPFKKVYRVAG
jgi:hypothetical protein